MWSASDPYVPGEILNTLNLKACVLIFFFFFNPAGFQESHLTVVNGECRAVALPTEEETLLRKNVHGKATARFSKPEVRRIRQYLTL